VVSVLQRVLHTFVRQWQWEVSGFRIDFGINVVIIVERFIGQLDIILPDSLSKSYLRPDSGACSAVCSLSNRFKSFWVNNRRIIQLCKIDTVVLCYCGIHAACFFCR
jgi:hypothetical protein